MKLRKIGAACLASAVMMSSAAVMAYADEATTEAETAAVENVTAELTASGLTQEQVSGLIKTVLEVKSREEIAEFLGGLESVKAILAGFEMDTIGDEDLGTLIASMSPDDLAEFTAWVAEAKLETLSDDEVNDLVEEALGDMSEEDLAQLQELIPTDFTLSDEEIEAAIANMSEEELQQLVGAFSEDIANALDSISSEDLNMICQSVIPNLSEKDLEELLIMLGVADNDTVSTITALPTEEIQTLISMLPEESMDQLRETLKVAAAYITASVTDIPVAGDVDAATDVNSSKGSPDTGIADVAAVAGVAVLAIGGIMIAKKRK